MVSQARFWELLHCISSSISYWYVVLNGNWCCIDNFTYQRRSKKRKEERENANAFDPADFRRSAIMMHDPPTHDDTVSRGFNPRPPSMIERKLASPAPTYGPHGGMQPGMTYNPYGDHSQGQYGYGAGDNSPYGNGMDHQAQYAPPHQMMNQTPTSLFSPSAYGQSPFSPVTPGGFVTRRTSAGSSNGHQGQEARESPFFTQPNSTAAGLAAAAQYATYPTQPGTHDHQHNQPTAANSYVDLDRSSVTPFQAQQYAEISRKLNTQVPTGGAGGQSSLRMQNITEDDDDDFIAPPPPPQKYDVSPFADPTTPRGQQFSLDHQPQAQAQTPVQSQFQPQSQSQVQQQQQQQEQDEDDFSAGYYATATPTAPSLPRVTSIPPMLPEIHVQPRVSVNVHGEGGAGGFEFPNPRFAQSGTFPVTPSPLASSFGDEVHAAVGAGTPAAVAAPASAPSQVALGKRPETVYDPEDAYGGI